MYQLFEQKREAGLLYENGILNERDYKNMVTVLSKLKPEAEVLEFIEKEKKRLPPDIKEEAHAYTKAVYYFKKGQFEKARDILINQDFSIALCYNIDSRALKMMICYELGGYRLEDEFENIKKAFDVHIPRKKKDLSAQELERYKNFSWSIRQLFPMKHNDVSSRPTYPKATAAIAKIEMFIKQGKVAFKDWLQTKVNEMKAQYKMQ